MLSRQPSKAHCSDVGHTPVQEAVAGACRISPYAKWRLRGILKGIRHVVIMALVYLFLFSELKIVDFGPVSDIVSFHLLNGF